VSDFIPFFRFFNWIGRKILCRARSESQIEAKRRRLRKRGLGMVIVESNVPLEITLVLSK
jgi:hypothetical protein